MKWLITIWAFYVLALSMAPCSDAYNICDNDESTAQVAENHSHGEDRDDNCTPFCYCTCCNANLGAIQFNLTELVQPAGLFVSEKIVIRDCSFQSNYSGNIWQPPRA